MSNYYSIEVWFSIIEVLPSTMIQWLARMIRTNLADTTFIRDNDSSIIKNEPFIFDNDSLIINNDSCILDNERVIINFYRSHF